MRLAIIVGLLPTDLALSRPNLSDRKGCIMKIDPVDLTTKELRVAELAETNPLRVELVDPTTKEPVKVEPEETNPLIVDSKSTAGIARFDRN